VHKLKELKKINSILIATNNPGKFKEIKDLLPKKIKCFKPKDFDLKRTKRNSKNIQGQRQN
jgi:XTP/dITP diphosphohydrolase